MANKYLRKVGIPAAATETTLYTVPAANAAILRSLRVTNANASRSTITVTQYSAGDATPHYLLKSNVVVTNTTYDLFNGVPLIMEEGDILKITSTLASVNFYLSYLEVDRS
jgi:hypothetical protein